MINELQKMLEKYQEQLRKQAKEIGVLRLQLKDTRTKYADTVKDIDYL
jgi:hypothetical protein